MNIAYLIEEQQKQKKWDNDIERRLKALKYLDFYNNNEDEYLEEKIDDRYDKREAKVIKGYIETMPLTERLINDSSLLFRESPEITTDDESQNEKLQKMIDDLQIDAYLRDINKLTNLLFDVAVMPNIRDGKLVLDIITPDMMFVEQDPNDPKKAIRIYYSVGQTVNTTTNSHRLDLYEFWDATGKYSCTVDMQTGNVSNIEQLEAPDYKGEIPVVMFRNYIPKDSFFSEKSNSIVKLHEAIDMRLTALNCMEDFNIPARVNVGVPSDQEFKLGFSFMTNIPANDMGQAVGDSKYINPNSPVQEEWQLIENRMIQGALSVGLSTASIKGSEFSSGYHLKLSKEEILAKNAEQRPYYYKSIKDLIRLLSITDGYAKEKYGLNPDNEIYVNFGEIEFLESAEEKARTRSMQLANGTKSVIDFLIEDDPDLTEDDAVLLKAKIDSYNNRFNPRGNFQNALDRARLENVE